MRDAVLEIIRSQRLRPILERFHGKISELGIELTISGSRLGCGFGGKTDPEVATTVLLEHVLRTLTIEASLDDELFDKINEVRKELKERKNELMASQEFLEAFTEVLAESKNTDDLNLLAKLCVDVCSVRTGNAKLAKMAETAQPELIIEMAKALVVPFVPKPPIVPREEERPAPARAEPSAPAAVEKPPRKSSTPPPRPKEHKTARAGKVENPAERLVTLLSGIGVDASTIEQITGSERYAQAARTCVVNLEDFIEQHGKAFALVAVHKNRELMLGRQGPVLDSLKEELEAVRGDQRLLDRYRNFTELLARELEVPAETVYLVLSSFQGGRVITEALAMDNARLLLERVPKDKLRKILLCSPSKFAMARDIKALLEEHSEGIDADEEKMIRDVIALANGRRPEAFIRNFIHANLSQLVSRSPEAILNKVEWGARTLTGMATKKGIPEDVVSACLEAGMLTIQEIDGRSQRAQALDAMGEAQAREVLRSALHDIGIDSDLINTIMNSPSYSENPKKCLRILDKLTALYGTGTTVVILYKKRTVLLGEEGGAMDDVVSDIRAMRTETKKLEKYQKIAELLSSELEIPEEAALYALAKIQRGNADQLLEDITILVSRVPKEKLRRMVLSGPHFLGNRGKIYDAIREHGAAGSIPVQDDELIGRVVELSQGRRPEPFIRAIFGKNPLLFSMTAEGACKHIEYRARMLLGMAKSSGVPVEYVTDCLGRGVVDIESIIREYRNRPKDHQNGHAHNGHSHLPVSQATVIEFPRAPVRPVIQPSSASGPVSSAYLAGAAALEVEPAAPAPVTLPAPAPTVAPPSGEIEITEMTEDRSSDELVLEEIGKVLHAADLGPERVSGLMDDITRNSLQDRVLDRLWTASDILGAYADSEAGKNLHLHDFLIRGNTIRLLVGDDDEAYGVALVAFRESLSGAAANGKRASKPANGTNGNGANSVRHVRIADGDLETFEKIKRVKIREDLSTFLVSRRVDVHEFCYVVFKIFRWMGSPLASDVKEEDYESNISRFSGEAEKEVRSILGKISKVVKRHPKTRMGLLKDSEAQGIYSEIIAMLNRVHHLAFD